MEFAVMAMVRLAANLAMLAKLGRYYRSWYRASSACPTFCCTSQPTAHRALVSCVADLSALSGPHLAVDAGAGLRPRAQVSSALRRQQVLAEENAVETSSKNPKFIAIHYTLGHMPLIQARLYIIFSYFVSKIQLLFGINKVNIILITVIEKASNINAG